MKDANDPYVALGSAFVVDVPDHIRGGRERNPPQHDTGLSFEPRARARVAPQEAHRLGEVILESVEP